VLAQQADNIIRGAGPIEIRAEIYATDKFLEGKVVGGWRLLCKGTGLRKARRIGESTDQSAHGNGGNPAISCPRLDLLLHTFEMIVANARRTGSQTNWSAPSPAG
jgi:hypothetical protein